MYPLNEVGRSHIISQSVASSSIFIHLTSDILNLPSNPNMAVSYHIIAYHIPETYHLPDSCITSWGHLCHVVCLSGEGTTLRIGRGATISTAVALFSGFFNILQLTAIDDFDLPGRENNFTLNLHLVFDKNGVEAPLFFCPK